MVVPAAERGWLSLESFWYTNSRNFDTMSGTPSFDLEFHLEGEMSGPRSLLCLAALEASSLLRPLCARAVVISGRYPAPSLLTLNFTLKIKRKVKGHGCVSCPVRLAIV